MYNIYISGCYSLLKGGIRNPTDYEEVGSGVTQVNPAVNSETDKQSNDGVTTYENICVNVQMVGESMR